MPGGHLLSLFPEALSGRAWAFDPVHVPTQNMTRAFWYIRGSIDTLFMLGKPEPSLMSYSMQAREVLQEESNVQPVVGDRHS